MQAIADVTSTAPHALQMPQPLDTTHQLPTATGPRVPPLRRAADEATSPEGGPEGDGQRPQGPEALREDIEQTRARMSGTLDRIEERITERRREVWAKVTLGNVRTAVTTEPWRSLLIAFAAGYVAAALRD